MTHQDHTPTNAAAAAGRRVIHDPENVSKAKRIADCSALAESDIKAALRKAGCGIVKRPRVPAHSDPWTPPAHLPNDPPRDWLWVKSEGQQGPTLAAILQAVSFVTKISVTELKSPRRRRSMSRARMIYYVVAKELTNFSLPQIGRHCGGKDHSTVLHGIHRVADNRAEFEPDLSAVMAFFAEAPWP